MERECRGLSGGKGELPKEKTSEELTKYKCLTKREDCQRKRVGKTTEEKKTMGGPAINSQGLANCVEGSVPTDFNFAEKQERRKDNKKGAGMHAGRGSDLTAGKKLRGDFYIGGIESSSG